MQLTYNNQTPLAGGCYEKHDSGVSRFGEMVIEEMNRLGMIVDLSHAGRQTCLDAINPVSRAHAVVRKARGRRPHLRRRVDEHLHDDLDSGFAMEGQVFTVASDDLSITFQSFLD